jgi:Glycosyltransferase family 87
VFGSCGVLCVVAALSAIVAGIRGRALRCARLGYIATVLAAVTFWGVFFVRRSAPQTLLTPGPLSDLGVTLLCVGLSWALLGFILFFAGRKPWTAERAAYWLALVVLGGLYLNVLRERETFGDFYDYVVAAGQLKTGQPFHPRYLYPPLLATLLSPFVGLGDEFILLLCLTLNWVAVLLAFVLIRRCLLRYGFVSFGATLLAFSALAVNVAVLRTFFYVQTNLHVTNLMLISLLCYPAPLWASALALALAAHIKTSPLALVLPFVLNRDYRWIGWFALFMLAIIGLTSAHNGLHRYFEYLDNVAHIYRANGISFRENSIDSLVRITYWELGLNIDDARTPIVVLRALLTLLSLALCGFAMRKRTFSGGPSGNLARALDAFPVLMLFLMSVSPLVWEHHPVIIVLSLLVMLKQLDNQADVVLWLGAWFLCFFVPTFDVYPFSFRITLGVFFAYWLLLRVVRRDTRYGRYFARANAALARFGGVPSATTHSERSIAPPVSSK